MKPQPLAASCASSPGAWDLYRAGWPPMVERDPPASYLEKIGKRAAATMKQ